MILVVHPKQAYLADVERHLGDALTPETRRRALWFYLCDWHPAGAALQLRCEREDLP